MSKKRIIRNSEFLENKVYYEKHLKKYNKENGLYISNDSNLIILNIFKLWADVVQETTTIIKKIKSTFTELTNFL